MKTPKLYPYQIEGAEWLSGKTYCLLADEQGLGKSAQSINAARLLSAKDILVVCRAVAISNWKNEFLIFGSGDEKVTVTSYESLRHILEKNLSYDVLIVDESHYVKSGEAQRTKQILGKGGAVHRARYRWFLTGTPTPNNNSELWPFLFTGGRTRLSPDEFTERYCLTAKTGYGIKVIGNNLARTEELRGLLQPICLRRTAEGVNLQLPAIVYSDLILKPGPVNVHACKTFFKWTYPKDRLAELTLEIEMQLGVVGGIVKGGFTDKALAALKAASKSISTLRMYTGMQKVEPILELVRGELDSGAYEKIVLFTWHKDVTNALAMGLKKKYGARSIYGGSDPVKIAMFVRDFQEKKSARVLVCNVQTAGTSITLTAATDAIFVETSYVPADIDQAAKRLHRIGQTKPVRIRFAALEDSIDQHIQMVLRRKTSEISALMDELTERKKLRSTKKEIKLEDLF